jgi:hypothetical protein
MDAPNPRQRTIRRPAISREARAVFLEHVANAYSITVAAKVAGVHRRRFYELAHADERFREELQEAHDKGTDVIRDEIRRRAVEGWDEAVFQKGELVGHVRKYSDRLLELEARRRGPAYRDNHRVELSGPVPVEEVGPARWGGETTLVGVIRLAQEIGLGHHFDQALGELGYVRVEVEQPPERPALPPAPGDEQP